MTFRPTEWDVLHPRSGQPLAIVRLVHLGPEREPYYRAVTANPERESRKLIGYWGNLDDAHAACLALHAHAGDRAAASGGAVPQVRLPAQKPPPAARGRASTERSRVSRG